MNSKAEFNVQGMIFGLLFIGLTAGVIGAILSTASNTYDTTGYDPTSLEKYNSISTLNTSLRDVESATDTFAVKEDLFDYFAGVWNKLTSPFRTVYRSYKTLNVLTNEATNDLGLLPIFKDFAVLGVIVLVIVGIVLIQFYLARRK